MHLTSIDLTDIPGFAFGNWTDEVGGTGCTAIVAPQGAVGGVDVRGGAPASRETDLLKPENTVDRVHAVILSGGSAFGLEAASGAARELEARGIGLNVGPTVVPIVCSSCIFDLAFGDPNARPDIAAGACAVRDALDGSQMPLLQGNHGAGCGATVGKIAGMERAMKGGLGTSAYALGALRVGALAAVNACGNVIDPRTSMPIAGMRAAADSSNIIDMEDVLLAVASDIAMPLSRTNTTISCIVTNAKLSKAQATKISQMAADAYAHTIRPTHTTNDGDTIYTLASGAVECPSDQLDLLGLMATRALEDAIASACRHASASHGVPGFLGQ